MRTRMSRTMTLRRAPVALLALFALAACTEPAATPKPPETQQSLSNLRDWNAAAARLVRSMAQQGFLPGSPRSTYAPFPPPFYVNVMQPGSTFLVEMKEAVEEELMRHNVPVARSPQGATVLNLDVDVVHWGSVAYPGGLLTVAGAAGAVAIGMASSAPISVPAAAFTSLGAGTAADFGLALWPSSRTEIVWRASVVGRNRELMRGSEVMYVATDDMPLYLGRSSLPAMASPGTSDLGVIRRLRYDP